MYKTYVLASADQRSIDLFHKDQQDKWDIISYQAGDLVKLQSIGLTFSLGDVYQELVFEFDR